MLHRLLTVFVFVSCVIQGTAQCNGSSHLCDQRYDQVAFLTTHNAYNAGNEGFTFPNHTFGVAQQLNDGVRGLMLDVYDQNGSPVVYHGSAILGSQPLSSDLDEVKAFLDAHPTEIVTLILECYVDAVTIETALSDAGMLSMVYAKPAGQEWATLGEMVTNNTRLVVFSDVNDAGAGQEWYHYVWDHAVETHFSVSSSNSFTNDYNRGDAANDLFIFNHFVTNATFGVAVESEAQVVNTFAFLMARIEGHYAEYAKFPNFITVDFYHHGEGLMVVDSLNAPSYVGGIDLLEESIRVTPNPIVDEVRISGLDETQQYLVEIVSMRGRVKRQFTVEQLESSVLNVGNLSAGTYIIRVSTDGALYYNHQVIIAK